VKIKSTKTSLVVKAFVPKNDKTQYVIAQLLHPTALEILVQCCCYKGGQIEHMLMGNEHKTRGHFYTMWLMKMSCCSPNILLFGLVSKS
jgi:hypothetical protein